MQYAVSDIHGCYDKYIQFLRRIDFKESDTLYVLGDMIDRGPDGLKILLDISMHPNIIPFLGNHESVALTCLPWLMEEVTVYEETEAGGREFVLVHAGLGGFSPERALDDYQLDELILSRPDPGQTWFRDKYLVFGHTPTPYYTGVPDCRDARIFRKDKLIAIDCGCSAGGPLGCICLDTLEEFYV